MTSSDRISAFTEHSDANPSIIFPNHGLQILSSVLNLGGISLISYVFARRTIFDELLTIRGWLSLTWPRLCVVLVFVTSWAFLYTAGVLISGAGMSLNQTTCELGILSCIILYATTKILIYMFLMEKVWIVWAPPSATGLESRWKSPIYRTCVVIMFPYYVIIVLMFLGRIAELRDHDGVCVIGLQKIS
ncbi:hypothetical protein FRC03_003840 [Tulasnella sp. 419]|nr:hypothetical protein FRC03_003840 [Tulasnella sp. 419]